MEAPTAPAVHAMLSCRPTSFSNVANVYNERIPQYSTDKHHMLRVPYSVAHTVALP